MGEPPGSLCYLSTISLTDVLFLSPFLEAMHWKSAPSRKTAAPDSGWLALDLLSRVFCLPEGGTALDADQDLQFYGPCDCLSVFWVTIGSQLSHSNLNIDSYACMQSAVTCYVPM